MPTALDSWTVQPHGPLMEVDDRLLSVAGEIVMPLGRFPRRMSVVGLAGGRTAIFSAIALDEPDMERIETLGAPAFLIIPNAHHRLDARIWKQRYPGLTVVAPPGAREAVEEVVPVDATDDVLGDPESRFSIVEGTDGQEAALLVRRGDSLSLIANDVIAHVAHPHGLGAQIMSRLFGFGVAEPQVPRPVRAKLVTDAASLAAQFRAWAAEPGLTRIIPSHGEIIEQGPTATLFRLADQLSAPKPG